MIEIGGIYEHYKRGGQYKILCVAKDSETLEDLVVYKALYGDGQVWIRNLNMFAENVERDGQEVPRFKYIGKD
jgi:hypothetical protein